ncbi:hypothetical protein G5I_12270 [Acromyrmex echinatior]|uniref:Uncharacterized protein n=1 Tax=Acromyrmex echinatior TaxID=103372 RepID=F4X1V2_ACREC|nr:hypothetical protein G5I_12270 [Acromyrmex echinatior]
MKITRIEVPSRVKEMLGDSLDSSLRNPSSRNDYSEDRTGIGTNLSDKILFGLANGAQMAFIDHIRGVMLKDKKLRSGSPDSSNVEFRLMNIDVKVRERREVRLEFEFRHVTLAGQSESVVDSTSLLCP